MEIEKKVEDVLIKAGIPAHLSGFDYIKEAVIILDRDGMNVKWMEIYSEIANKFGKTVDIVERAIRNALAVARSSKSDYEMASHYIGFVNVGNASSISLLYRRIKREMEEEQVHSETKCADEQPVISEDRVREIVRQTVKEMLGGIA